ncbi:L-amino acid oxidase bordonein-L-like [Mercenaria mercenaria]|uniref:L-amino acid oxidase bordonein-L-like n=1 Tax=Mercenaria mercenaria TaxID=6596 RepID=UPI00234FAB29|nr:L-amino acid oxidase bordonein-L-like [Mercenaria mercenaria]
MRLPYNHFLTRHYIKLFNIETSTFQDYNENAFMSLYGDPPIKISDWNKNDDFYCSKYWPGWDEKLLQTEGLKTKLGIRGIRDYFKCTVEKIKQDLGSNPNKEMWLSWIKKWSKFSLEDFFRSCILQTANEPQLRPWPEAAIEAFKVSTYRPLLGKDLILYLRIQFGEWRVDPMYTPTFGMDELPKSFIRKNENGWNKSVDLSKNLKYGFMVTKIQNINEGRRRNIKVIGKNDTTGTENVVYADAVFLTVPVHALRQIEIPLTLEQKKALDDVVLIQATKIHLQCRRRFWQKDRKDDESHKDIPKDTSSVELQGGCSITDQQIGRLYYPDFVKSGRKEDERGILQVYALQDNAVVLGSETAEVAIKRAISQIKKIHPEIEDEFEAGTVQAWINDQTPQSSFADLNPFEYTESLKNLTESTETIYIANDTLSWSNAWIQGSIFSALFQAYCFQSRIEGCTSKYNLVSFVP